MYFFSLHLCSLGTLTVFFLSTQKMNDRKVWLTKFFLLVFPNFSFKSKTGKKSNELNFLESKERMMVENGNDRIQFYCECTMCNGFFIRRHVFFLYWYMLHFTNEMFGSVRFVVKWKFYRRILFFFSFDKPKWQFLRFFLVIFSLWFETKKKFI